MFRQLTYSEFGFEYTVLRTVHQLASVCNSTQSSEYHIIIIIIIITWNILFSNFDIYTLAWTLA
jgi:hypothetical protein